MTETFAILEKLENSQYPNEPKPVGGFGAGVAFFARDGDLVLEKVGSVNGSPAKRLSQIVHSSGAADASTLIGHVRMPSPEYMSTAELKETAQPYVGQHDTDLTVVSVHNGKVLNYSDLRAKLGQKHILESEKHGLIDSEVIPHYFAQLYEETKDPEKALKMLYDALEGSNSLAILHLAENDIYLHFIHKGETRGLHVWTNSRGEVIFCSRAEPCKSVLDDLFKDGKFNEKISVGYHEEANIKLSLHLLAF